MLPLRGQDLCLNKAILGIIFQQFFLSCHRSIYWGYVIRYNTIQDEIYLCKDTFDHFIPHNARSVIDMVAESIARVGFLNFKTARTPGAVNTWINAIVSCAECPAPPKLDYTKLSFFRYSPVMGRWLSQSFSFYNPILCDPFYTNYLDHETFIDSYYPEDSDVDNYFGWDKVLNQEGRAAKRANNNSNFNSRSNNNSGNGLNNSSRGSGSSSGSNKSSGNSSSNSSGNKSNANSNSGSNLTSNTTNPVAQYLGKDGKLKPEEKERQKKNNLCMFCGGKHKTDDCRKRSAAGSQAKGCAAATSDASTSKPDEVKK
ncbi:hypothetical protein PM082_008378 [Marasmius tenuissimus]|nr:hypothetical protein PM082_008378 [Marasmius tenuissimus]